MVKITGIRHCKNAEGEEFVSFVLHGEIDLVQSKATGRWYATAAKASITCTFDEAIALSMVGKELPGIIEKVETEPYKYVIPESGEEITLQHQWVFNPENKTVEDEVFLN